LLRVKLKVRKYSFLSFLRKQESSNFKGFWMLDQVQHDGFETFYELVNFGMKITDFGATAIEN